jgi:hypothetical protein
MYKKYGQIVGLGKSKNFILHLNIQLFKNGQNANKLLQAMEETKIYLLGK